MTFQTSTLDTGKLRKVRELMDRGATAGEQAAARGKAERLTLAPSSRVTRPSPERMYGETPWRGAKPATLGHEGSLRSRFCFPLDSC